MGPNFFTSFEAMKFAFVVVSSQREGNINAILDHGVYENTTDFPASAQLHLFFAMNIERKLVMH